MRRWICAISLALASGSTVGVHGQDLGSTTQGISSLMGGMEGAIDAPWRIEPESSSSLPYRHIPIVVSLHDASLQSDPATALQLGQFCEVVIREEGQTITTIYGVSTFMREVERSDKWPYSSDVAANHRLCRRWSGEYCTSELNVGSTAEWHGTVLFTPRTQMPGADVRLTVQARVARAGHECGTPLDIVDSAPFDRLGYFSGPAATSYLMTNRLRVHLGEERLPRFEEGSWVYGDLHYHSQGTDNEGESAYAYRPTLQAMRAMGLDFLFATDHASDSGQTTDIDEIYIDNINLPYVPSSIEDFLERLVAGYALGFETSTNAARDMNPHRFAAMRAWLNDWNGANEQVMRLPGRNHAPRIFLGGEVDVIPEMSASEKAARWLSYGNNRSYGWANACTQVPSQLQALEEWTTASVCESVDDLVEPASEGGRYLLKDIQGLGDQYFARQHLVHLPMDGTRDDAFVASSTTLFGGAYRRLRDVLHEDYAVGNKGYAFLAHPVNGASGNGLGRLGPDIVPYSDVQLRTAFGSPSILGLQLWNEDARLRTGGGGGTGFPLQPQDLPLMPLWHWQTWLGPAPTQAYRELHDGLWAWDKMLLWGIRPSQTAGLSWLAAGEPRRVFMAGGSDAHGDWNYRREGSLTGVSAIVDTAIGKPRNLVYVGPDRPETVVGAGGETYGAVGQAQVTSALASGHFSVTDGPALRIAVDTNRNGLIDATDVPMGGVTDLPGEGSRWPFIVEWNSTDEFGPIAGIDLYVGVSNSVLDEGLVYAPVNHGVHSSSTRPGTVGNSYLDASGVAHPQLRDGYMLDPTGHLHITPAATEAKKGRRVFSLRLNDYVVGRRRVAYEEPVCHPNIYCSKPGYAELCDDVCTTPAPTYHFDNVSLPDRMYVRAFARTTPKAGNLCATVITSAIPTDPALVAQRTGQCIERLAFTNPIWADVYVAPVPPNEGLVPVPPLTRR